MTKILVVEDSATQAEELRLILEEEEFAVTAAFNAEQALERLGAESFDLVISDIIMPGMTGYELCRQLKASPAHKRVPIILLTTLSNPMDVIQGLESGADHFLTKPYEAADLVARVNNILETHRLRNGGLQDANEIVFLGRRFAITSDKEQILSLLVSTFEDTVRKNRQLQQSQAELAETLEKLKEANQELEAFSYSVSHDLRAPLRSILGFSQALQRSYPEGLDGRAYLDRICGAAHRMSELIDDLLKLSQVTRAELNFRPVDLSELAREVVEELRARDSESQRQVQVTIQDRLICHGDESLLRVVMENLLGNAWKFTRDVQPADIRLEARQEGGQRVFQLRDNGAGFDPDYASKLFAPFQRLHRADEFPGTGIGLAIVGRIIHRHNGRIYAEGAVNRGATIHFSLSPATLNLTT